MAATQLQLRMPLHNPSQCIKNNLLSQCAAITEVLQSIGMLQKSNDYGYLGIIIILVLDGFEFF